MNVDSDFTPPFDEKFSRYDEEGRAGLAVMAILGGVTKFKKGYGLRNLETKEKIDCDTNFRMASVSKQFTAMCVAILEDRGKISRDDYISQYMKELPEYMRAIKVSHLVHHLSGLPNYGDALFSTDKSKPLISNHDVYNYYKKQEKLDFSVGKQYEYSNGGYSLLALVIENAAGQSFQDFCREHLFIPAGMKNTAIIEYPSTIKNQAISYSAWPFFEDIDFNTLNALHGDDGVYTSLTDMEAWIKAIEHNTLVGASTTQRLFATAQTNDGEKVKYGYGWELEKFHDIDIRVHGGREAGFNTVVINAPERKMWFVGFSNTEAIDSDDAAIEMAKYYLDIKSD